MADETGAEAVPSKAARPSKKPSNVPRKRVSQACDRCRARKDKCDGQKPVCSTCAAQDAPCNYDSNTKKRGLPEGYVRGLEKLWGLSIREVDDIEESVITALSNESIAETWSEPGNDAAESLQETWRNSRISKELERLLPLLEVEDKSGKRKREAGRADSMSGIRPALKASPALHDAFTVTAGMALSGNRLQPMGPRLSVSTTLEAPVVSTAESDGATTSTSHTMQDNLVSSSIKTTNSPMSLPSRTFQLIDIYFSYTHSWFPILEKYDIMRFSHQYCTAILDLSPSASVLKPSTSGNNAVLWALLAYSDYQRQSLQNDNQEPKPDELFEHARSLIPHEEEALDIGHTQALLILTLYCIGRGRWTGAWSLIGQAARLAIELGFGRPDLPKSKRSQHVFLGCFVLDTLIAARLKRRPQMRREDISDIRVEEDGLEEWDPAPDCLNLHKQASRGPAGILSTFNGLINVLAVLNDVICGTSTQASNYQSLLVEIETLNQLPPQFAPTWAARREEVTQAMLPHHYHLHVAYITTSAVLYFYAKQQSPFSAQQVAASTLRQIAKVLKHHSQHFGLVILPPTYDYYTLIAGECTVIDQNPLDDYRLDIQHSLTAMVKTWPTYKDVSSIFKSERLEAVSDPSLQEQPAQKSQSERLSSSSSRSQVPLTVPRMRQANTATQFPTPSNMINHTRSPSVTRFNSGDQDLLNSFGKSPLINLSTLQNLSPSATFIPQTPMGNQSWSNHTPGTHEQFSLTTQTSQAFDTASASNLDIDGDSMFNEFATLDAMEWTNNWDQSLLNLGFTDPASMNRDFYAFCREPDPLYPSGLVQQLLSSNMHGVGGMGVDTGNGNVNVATGAVNAGVDMMNFTNPHVEASQILQGLAAGREGERELR